MSDIKQSYIAIARKNHPDVTDDAAAALAFQRAAAAYEVLMDRDARAQYDQTLPKLHRMKHKDGSVSTAQACVRARKRPRWNGVVLPLHQILTGQCLPRLAKVWMAAALCCAPVITHPPPPHTHTTTTTSSNAARYALQESTVEAELRLMIEDGQVGAPRAAPRALLEGVGVVLQARAPRQERDDK